MKKIKYFILMFLLLTPMIAHADTFKDGDTTYVIEEKEYTCVSKTAYLIAVDGDGNYIFMDPYATKKEYIKVNVKGECSKISQADYDALKGDDISYSFELDNDKYVIVKHTPRFDTYGSFKTKDTTVAQTKNYFKYVTSGSSSYFEYVDEPQAEELDQYYEMSEFVLARGTTFNSNGTYYVIDESYPNDNIFVLVEDPKEENLKNYYIENRLGVDREVIDVVNQEKIKKIAEDLTYYPSDIYPLGNNKFLIGFVTEDLASGDNYYIYYDSDGNYVEAFEYARFLDVLDSGLYIVENDNTFSIYNAKYEEIYESKNQLLYPRVNNYLNNVHYVSGYGNEDFQRLLEITEYKVLDGENQSYNNTSDKKEDLSIRVTGSVEDVAKVYVDNKVLDGKNYTLTSGSVIVTLKKDYLHTLTTGKHTLKVEFLNGGNVEAQFNITNTDDVDDEDKDKDDENVPDTSDNIYAYFLLLGISLSSIGFCTKYLRKN